MNLYKISQDEVDDYDTYDSAVVAAPNEARARCLHPSGYQDDIPNDSNSTWTNDPSKVKVELLGTAIRGTKEGIIVASFNAG